MEKARYSIIFSSLTGNTKELANAIKEALPKNGCDYFGEADAVEPQSETVYLGFWTDKGTADEKTLKLLKRLKNKNIFLFGTAGFGASEDYYKKILGNIKQSIDSSNKVIGEFMCQGKMPQSVKERYEKMKQQPNCIPNIDMLIENFNTALTHPDENDLNRLKQAVLK